MKRSFSVRYERFSTVTRRASSCSLGMDASRGGGAAPPLRVPAFSHSRPRLFYLQTYFMWERFGRASREWAIILVLEKSLEFPNKSNLHSTWRAPPVLKVKVLIRSHVVAHASTFVRLCTILAGPRLQDPRPPRSPHVWLFGCTSHHDVLSRTLDFL